MLKITKYLIFSLLLAAFSAGQSFAQNEELLIGSEIELGTWLYEKNGRQQPMRWIVMEKKLDNSVLLVCKEIVEFMPFNKLDADASWESSGVRNWLNSFFYENAFSNEEKGHILKGIAVPEDHVFLLSAEEAKEYGRHFDSFWGYNSGLRAKPIPYMEGKANTYYGYAWQWLRSQGMNEKNVAAINPFGKIYYRGYSAMNEAGGVRPAMWYQPRPAETSAADGSGESPQSVPPSDNAARTQGGTPSEPGAGI